jgi:predicted transcriptional regulator
MPPTTLKLPAGLKERLQAVVADTGESVHAFMLKAIEQATIQAEHRRSFMADALEARAEFARTGMAFDAREVHRYARARAAGKPARRPKAKRWRG